MAFFLSFCEDSPSVSVSTCCVFWRGPGVGLGGRIAAASLTHTYTQRPNPIPLCLCVSGGGARGAVAAGRAGALLRLGRQDRGTCRMDDCTHKDEFFLPRTYYTYMPLFFTLSSPNTNNPKHKQPNQTKRNTGTSQPAPSSPRTRATATTSAAAPPTRRRPTYSSRAATTSGSAYGTSG